MKEEFWQRAIRSSNTDVQSGQNEERIRTEINKASPASYEILVCCLPSSPERAVPAALGASRVPSSPPAPTAPEAVGDVAAADAPALSTSFFFCDSGTGVCLQ